MIKRKSRYMIGLWLGLAWLSGCGQVLDMPVGTPKETDVETSGKSTAGAYEITAKDRDTQVAEAEEIDLSSLEPGSEACYEFDGRELRIQEEGAYEITGKMNYGSIVISVDEDEIVHLVLNGVELTSAQGPAIYVEKAAKVIITAKEGSENTLSDGVTNGKEQKACIFSNCDLTLNGSGRLSVYGYHADAVRSKDQLKIVDANFYAKAKENGIRGNDGVILIDSNTEVECEGTGIFARSDKDMVVVERGSLKVIAGENAVSASQYVSITGDQIDLYSAFETIQCEGIREFDEEMIK